MVPAIAPKAAQGKETRAMVGRAGFKGKWMLVLVCMAILGGCDWTVAADAPVAPPRVNGLVEQPTLTAALNRLAEYTKLRRALRDTGIAPRLSGRQAITLLAPRDNGFAQLDAEAQVALFAPANRPALTIALNNLILPRVVRADELRTMIDDGGGSTSLTALGGAAIHFTRDGDQLIATWPNGSRATMGTQEASAGNGIFYVIDHWPG